LVFYRRSGGDHDAEDPIVDTNTWSEYSRFMKLSFQKIDLPSEKQILVEWLSPSPWPFHGNSVLSSVEVEQMISEGVFDGTNHQSFWITADQQTRIGYVRLFDLDEGFKNKFYLHNGHNSIIWRKNWCSCRNSQFVAFSATARRGQKISRARGKTGVTRNC
jgi:hypothetical protein